MRIVEVHARPHGRKFKATIIWPALGPVNYIITGEELDEYCSDHTYEVFESIRRETWPHQLPLPETD